MFFKVISAPLQFGENQEINKRPPNFLDSQKLKLTSAPKLAKILVLKGGRLFTYPR